MRTRLFPVLFALLGCGGSAEPAGGTTAATTSEPDRRPWAELSQDERRAFMGRHVLPEMTALFQEHDDERYAAFSCDTCHGDDMAAHRFAMPNPGLLALYPTGHPEQLALVERDREMLTFMYQRVVPIMQQMLGAEAYDADSGTGFSCFTCHPAAEVEEGAASAI